jgi:hypothetical protein
MAQRQETTVPGKPGHLYVIDENLFGRKIICNAQKPDWAWSGARWVPHSRGIPLSIIHAQISNFATEAEADEYAKQFGFGATNLTSEGPPVPLDFTLCLRCATVLRWDFKMQLHPVTKQELRELPIKMILELARVKTALRQVKAERN